MNTRETQISPVNAGVGGPIYPRPPSRNAEPLKFFAIPAKAGTHALNACHAQNESNDLHWAWAPAFAGVTNYSSSPLLWGRKNHLAPIQFFAIPVKAGTHAFNARYARSDLRL